MKWPNDGSIRAAALLTTILLVPALSLHAFVPMRWGAAGVRGAWSAAHFPLAFYLNDATAKGTPNLASGSDPLSAVRAALASWQSIPTAVIRFADLKTTTVDSGQEDGINLITMADTAANRQIVGGALGAVALTRITFNANTGEITDSDVILNPSYRFSTTLAPQTYDLQAIVTHEIGHALGCDHSPAQNDTMFAVMVPGEFFQRYLGADAVAFATMTYPDSSRTASLGVISGRISSAGKGVFGASVTAVNLDRNLVYASLSDSDGSFALNGMAAGHYQLYAEPLDGPMTPDQLMVQGSNAYYRGLSASFRTTFSGVRTLGIDGSPAKLTVNIPVPSGAPTLNIDQLGKGDPITGVGYLSDDAATVAPGETFGLWIAGANSWKVAAFGDIGILGTGITLDPAGGIKILQGVSGAAVGISVLAHVAPDATAGGRTITLKVGDQQVASTGGIVVAPRTLPSAMLYFPYLRASASIYTGIALANPTQSASAMARIYARDVSGALVWSDGAIIPADLTLPPGGQVAQLERQVFNLPPSADLTGSMTVESDNAGLLGFTLTGDFSGTVLDGGVPFTQGYQQLYFADVLQDQNTVTEIHLMNIGDVSAAVDFMLISADPNLVIGPIRRVISPGGKIGEAVSSLFGYSGKLHSAYVSASAQNAVMAGFGLVKQPGATFGLNALPAESAGTVLYSPQLAVGDYGLHYETRLNLINVGVAKTTVTVDVLDERGTHLAPSLKFVDLPAGGQVSMDVGTAFGLQQGQGYLRVSSSAGGTLMGNVMFGDADPTRGVLNFGAALPLFSTGSQNFIFAHLAQADGYFTGVAFLAPNGANAKVEALASDGTSMGIAWLDLRAGERTASLLSGLLPNTAGQMGGYVRVISDRPLIGFELFGSVNGQMLAAVPPQRPPD
jgi:hypothetical protein